MKNFFDNTDEEPFRDVPDEVSGKSAAEILQDMPVSSPQPRRAPLASPGPQPPEEEYEYDVSEELADDEEEDYSSVLADAQMRLEQGRLYETIMNHDLFEGMDSNPQAVKIVQKQIRKFAKEQMEIMLGMRRETAKVETLQIEFPFNEVEVNVLKMVAEKASGGASKKSDNFVPVVTRTTEELPVIGEKKRTGLNPIVGKKQPVSKAAMAKIQNESKQKVLKQPQQPLKQTAAAPVARKKSNTPDQIVVDGEVVTREQIDAQYDPNYKPLQKPIHEMTADELLAHNKASQKRLQRRVPNPSALPMPSFEQEQMIHTQRLLESSGSGAVQTILNAMNNQTKK